MVLLLSFGWTEIGDTVIFQSSDIGNKAWVLNKKKLIPVQMTDALNKRAAFLKSKKYK